MKPAEQFQDFYRADLLPHLEQLEAKRKRIAGQVVTMGLVTGGVTLALIVLVAMLAPDPGFGLIPLVIGAIVFFVLYARMTRGYVAEFKDNIIGRIVKFVDPGLSYEKAGFIPQATYHQSRIFLTGVDRYHGEDLVRGTVGKTAIQFSEIHSQYKTEHTDSKGRRRTQWHTIFKGIFFVADFNKHFRGETVVLPDAAQKLLGRLGQTFQSWNIARKGDLVRLEDVAFEERFVVYSDDQVEARYLLSTSLMSRIMAYRDRTGRQVHLSFVKSNIYVAITNRKDSFEPKLFSTVLDMKLTEEFLADIMLAVSIVEDLNLNTRIWTKE